mmetsp:Transcript_23667/g.74409  ORF Transcript_23667/g.74409 Transcript_23667/m.74409 type:complete len:255 (-) Transcript_23667:20-784(-)
MAAGPPSGHWRQPPGQRHFWHSCSTTSFGKSATCEALRPSCVRFPLTTSMRALWSPRLSWRYQRTSSLTHAFIRGTLALVAKTVPVLQHLPPSAPVTRTTPSCCCHLRSASATRSRCRTTSRSIMRTPWSEACTASRKTRGLEKRYMLRLGQGGSQPSRSRQTTRRGAASDWFSCCTRAHASRFVGSSTAFTTVSWPPLASAALRACSRKFASSRSTEPETVSTAALPRPAKVSRTLLANFSWKAACRLRASNA